MFEIMFHGRGGQGAVLAATLLANAAAKSGCHAQAFASYGSERRGGKVESYVRIAEEKVLVHSKLYQADLLVLMDDSLVNNPQVLSSVKEGTLVLINSAASPSSFPMFKGSRVITIDASKIALEFGLKLPSGMPIINTTVLGAIVALVAIVGIEQLKLALKEGKVPAPEKNIEAASEAYRVTKKNLQIPEMKTAVIGQIVRAVTERYPEYRIGLPPCTANCPAGEDIERTIYFIQQGKFENALGNILIENPFPGVCGRVCIHPCEENCNRVKFDEGIAARSMERSASDHAETKLVNRPECKPPTGKRVAVIGSGPAGMSNAYYLALMGHNVTVFEAAPVVGGVLRLGIPEYRLPRTVLNREVKAIQDYGVAIKTNSPIKSLDEVKSRGYDSVFIAIGAWQSLKLNVPGEGAGGTVYAIDFLRQINSGMKVKLGKNVVVIGGGSVAMDAARVALRSGANTVQIVCLECRDPGSKDRMPAQDEEILAAEREGITIHDSQGVHQLLVENGQIKGIENMTCLAIRDPEGRFNPKYDSRALSTVQVDNVIIAIGQSIDKNSLVEKLKFSSNGAVSVDPNTLETSVTGVFAGGDLITSSRSVVAAIASGKRAAIGIDLYLKGLENNEMSSYKKAESGSLSMRRYLAGEKTSEYDGLIKYEDLNTAYFERKKRINSKEKRTGPGVKAFEESHAGLSKVRSLAEAERCFHCGRCTLCENCYIFCPDLAIMISEDKESFKINKTQCKVCGICINECPRDALTWEGDGR